MTKDLSVFTHELFGSIRTVIKNGKIYFVGRDVAEALCYKEPHKAISAHCRGGINHPIIDKLGRVQDTKVITEGDIYRLITKASDQSLSLEIKTKAEKFESWIFDEIVPQIRETGGYIPTKQEDDDESILAKAFLIATKTIENKNKLINQQAQQIEEMQPKVEFTNRLLKSDDTLLIREYAKILQEEGFKLGEKKLYQWLRDNEYLMYNNEPYQKYMKYFVVKETPVYTYYGEKINKTTKIKPEGQLYFYNKLKKAGFSV